MAIHPTLVLPAVCTAEVNSILEQIRLIVYRMLGFRLYPIYPKKVALHGIKVNQEPVICIIVVQTEIRDYLIPLVIHVLSLVCRIIALLSTDYLTSKVSQVIRHYKSQIIRYLYSLRDIIPELPHKQPGSRNRGLAKSRRTRIRKTRCSSIKA